MEFDTTDILLLQSICNTEASDNGADLSNVISFADYSNHAIMTFAEFSKSLLKLKVLGLVYVKNGRLSTSTAFKRWRKAKYKDAKRIYISKEFDEIGSFLNEQYAQLIKDVPLTEMEIIKEDFEKAVSDYLDRMRVVIKK